VRKSPGGNSRGRANWGTSLGRPGHNDDVHLKKTGHRQNAGDVNIGGGNTTLKRRETWQGQQELDLIATPEDRGI